MHIFMLSFAKELSQLFESINDNTGTDKENLRGLGHLSLSHLRRVVKKTLGYHARHAAGKFTFLQCMLKKRLKLAKKEWCHLFPTEKKLHFLVKNMSFGPILAVL